MRTREQLKAAYIAAFEALVVARRADFMASIENDYWYTEMGDATQEEIDESVEVYFYES